MRCSVIAIVATAVSFVPRHSALCDWDRLDHSVSKDVADDLISAQRKFGCYYDDVSCSFFDGRGECVLSKSTIVRSKLCLFRQRAYICVLSVVINIEFST